MSLEVKINSYELPKAGEQPGVIADIVDLGLVDTAFGKKDRVRFVFVLAEKDAEGRQKRVFITATKSMNEKATLRKTLVKLGAKIDPKAKTVNLEPFVGQQVNLFIEIETGDDSKEYPKILAFRKPAAEQNVQAENFTRAKDRKNV